MSKPVYYEVIASESGFSKGDVVTVIDMEAQPPDYLVVATSRDFTAYSARINVNNLRRIEETK